MATCHLTAQRVRDLLLYNPESGRFSWRVNHGCRVKAGTVAGGEKLNDNGYRGIKLDSRTYVQHRLVWLYVTGEHPTGEIDHINGVRHDNRFVNLRDVSDRVNAENLRHPRKHNTTGFLGVSKVSKGGRFVARIRCNKVLRELGRFATPEEAHAVYLAAKRQLHAGCTI